jgi:hypothetical protein
VGATSTVLWTWVSEPYRANVSFEPCRAIASVDAGATTLPAMLVVDARDTMGNLTQQTLNVVLDVTMVSVAIENLPGRTAPGRALSFQVVTGAPVDVPPTVRIGESAASVKGDSTRQRFDVTLPEMPGLGMDMYGGAADAEGHYPEHMMAETEKMMDVVVEALATNGNVTKVTTRLMLSRMLWERRQPGPLPNPSVPVPAVWFPVAGSEGLSMLVESSDGGSPPPTLPATMDVTHGAPLYLPPALAVSPTGLPMVGAGLTRDGLPVLNATSGTEMRLVRTDGSTVDGPLYAGYELFRWSDELCFQTPQVGCGTSAIRFDCMGPGGIATAQVTANSWYPTVGAMNAVAGNAVFSRRNHDVSCTGCGPCNAGGLISGTRGNLRFQVAPSWASVSNLQQVVPLANGNFGVRFFDTVTGSYQAFVFDSTTGDLTARAFQIPGLTLSGPTFLFGPQGERLLTARFAYPDTVLELWEPDNPAPVHTVKLYGRFTLKNVHGSDGYVVGSERFALLLQPDPEPDSPPVLVVLDLTLRPVWMHELRGYRDVRLADGSAKGVIYVYELGSNAAMAFAL